MGKRASIDGAAGKHEVPNLLLSYAIAFVVPLLILFGAYLLVREQLTGSESARIRTELSDDARELRYTLDGYYERTQAIALSIVQNEDLLSILRSDEAINRIDDPRIFRIAAQLRAMTISNGFIDDIVIHVNRNDMCIDQGGCLPDEGPFEEGGLGDGFTVGRALCGPDGSLCFLRSFPVTAVEDENRCMVLVRFKRRILSDLAKGKDEGLRFAIVDDQSGRNIASAFLGDDLGKASLELEGEEGQGLQDGYRVSYVKSARLPLTYVYAMPEALVSARQRRLGGGIMAIFALCAMLGCGLILYFSKKSLDPLKQLLGAVKGEKRGPVLGLLDPYYEIRTMLLDAASQKLAYAELHRQQAELEKKRAFVEALAAKDPRPESLSSHAADLGIDLENEAYCLIRLECRSVGDFFADVMKSKAEGGASPLVLCEGILRNLLSESCAATSVRYGSCVLLIAARGTQQIDRWAGFVDESIGRVQCFLRESYGIETVVGASNAHSGVGEAREAFEEASKAVEYIELTGRKEFLRFSQVPRRSHGNEASAAQMRDEARLVGCVKAGDFAKAKSFLNEILEAYFSASAHSPQLLKFRLYSLIGNILRAINGIDVPEIRKLAEKVEADGALYSCENIAQFQSELNGLFDELERGCRQAEASLKRSFRDEVKSIVSANYSNTELNVGFIADMMGRNLDSLSRAFSKAAGTGLLDYIHSVRIEKSKALLLGEGDFTIQRIALMVGYSNCESYIRAFKRIEGMTPGRYKAMARKK